MKTHVLSTALLVATLAGPAMAQDWIVYSGVELEYLNKPDGPGLPSRTNLSAYIEAERAGFYGGLWARKSDDDAYDEIDLYVGYRRDHDSGLSYDLGYARYFYPNDNASNSGEITLNVGQTLGESAAASVDVALDPESELGSLYLNGEVYLGEKWTVSASYGVYQNDGAPSEQEWEIGATYAITDEAAADLRWYDGSEYVEGYIGLSLSFDTTLFGG
jgi:uncharacterized protein (TIGR02001 family)